MGKGDSHNQQTLIPHEQLKEDVPVVPVTWEILSFLKLYAVCICDNYLHGLFNFLLDLVSLIDVLYNRPTSFRIDGHWEGAH